MDQPLVLDRYRLIERLAAGGSAEVWRAHDEQLDRPVAVKRLHPHLLPDAGSRRRLRSEARAAASLSHPVIVEIYDVDTEGEAPALVMELVDGESLSALLEREGPLPQRRAASIVADLAEALFHAHQRGVIHRDVKPGNVLLARDGRVRLVDFGIAHSLAPSAERLTLTGTIVGTLSSMAPEQLADGPITPRTDLYGLGVVLHEALTASPPYPASSPLALAEAQRAGPPRMASVDPGLAAVVAACLAYDPTDRPLHAGALASALRDWLAGDPTAALALAPVAAPPAPSVVDTSAITQQHAAVPTPESASAAPPPPHRRTGRLRVPWVLIGLAALAGLVIIGAVVASSSPGLFGPTDSPQPTVAPSQAPTAAPTPEPTAPPPPQLEGWARQLAEKYEKECGQPFDPNLIAGMGKQQAEDTVEPLIEACK